MNMGFGKQRFDDRFRAFYGGGKLHGLKSKNSSDVLIQIFVGTSRVHQFIVQLNCTLVVNFYVRLFQDKALSLSFLTSDMLRGRRTAVRVPVVTKTN